MKKTLLAIVVLLVVAAIPAAADPYTISSSNPSVTYVGASVGLPGNVSLNGDVTFTWQSNGQIKIVINNTSPYPLSSNPGIVSIQFSTTPNLTGVSLTNVSSSPNVINWGIIGTNNASGINWDLAAGANGNNCGGGGNAICAGGTATFLLSFDPTITNDVRVDMVDMKFKYNNGSTEVIIIPEPVPEPASLALLGTGLLGAGGFIRRKLIA